MSDSAIKERDRDTDSVFSEFNRSRGVRPFSPQPQRVRLNPEDLLVSLDRAESSNSQDETPPAQTSNKPDALEDANVEVKQETDRLDVEADEDDEAHPWRNEGIDRSDSHDAVGATGIEGKTLRWSTPEDDGA